MKSYNLWKCTGPPPCSKANGLIVENVVQPLVGEVPTFDAGPAIVDDRYFVTAKDTAGNESGETNVIVIVDATAPGIPQNFRCQTIEQGFICQTE